MLFPFAETKRPKDQERAREQDPVGDIDRAQRAGGAERVRVRVLHLRPGQPAGQAVR